MQRPARLCYWREVVERLAVALGAARASEWDGKAAAGQTVGPVTADRAGSPQPALLLPCPAVLAPDAPAAMEWRWGDGSGATDARALEAAASSLSCSPLGAQLRHIGDTTRDARLPCSATRGLEELRELYPRQVVADETAGRAAIAASAPAPASDAA